MKQKEVNPAFTEEFNRIIKQLKENVENLNYQDLKYLKRLSERKFKQLY